MDATQALAVATKHEVEPEWARAGVFPNPSYMGS
jgi:hypothetical protein